MAAAEPAVAFLPPSVAADLLRPLKNPDQHVRQAACQALAKCDCRSDIQIIEALVCRLREDKDIYVRQAAAGALGQAARRGDEAAWKALAQRCGMDSDAGVRRLCCLSLAQVAPKGCATVVGALAGRLEDKDGGVRRSALKGLEKVSEKGDEQVLAALFLRTTDSEAFVRHTAVEALAKLSNDGNPEVVARFLELNDTDNDARVRWSATEGLGRVAVRGDSRVMANLLAMLDDESETVRRAAAGALGRVTFAPLQELELQEVHIQEIETHSRNEVNALQAVIGQMREKHQEEVSILQRRNYDLEEELKRSTEERDEHIRRLEARIREQEMFERAGEFLPHAGKVMSFLDTLPQLAAQSSQGTEIYAPVWALRCVRGHGPTGCGPGPGKGGAPNCSFLEDSSPSKDKRELLDLFDLFEQLSTGRVTPLDLTETKPLDVYVHEGEDGVWGLYCCSRHRLLAMLMRQACARNEHIVVKCIIRPKDGLGYWGWHWNNFYDGGDGLNMNQSPSQWSPTGAAIGFGSITGRDLATCSSPARGSPRHGQLMSTGSVPCVSTPTGGASPISPRTFLEPTVGSGTPSRSPGTPGSRGMLSTKTGTPKAAAGAAGASAVSTPTSPPVTTSPHGGGMIGVTTPRGSRCSTQKPVAAKIDTGLTTRSTPSMQRHTEEGPRGSPGMLSSLSATVGGNARAPAPRSPPSSSPQNNGGGTPAHQQRAVPSPLAGSSSPTTSRSGGVKALIAEQVTHGDARNPYA